MAHPPRGSASSTGSSSPRASTPNKTFSAASVARCSATAARARRSSSARIFSSLRLAANDAFAATFVPSRVTVSNRTIPALAHSASTSANNRSTTSGAMSANRQTVLWSGTSPAQITRNATSSQHSRSICRDERTPRAYA